MAKSYDLKKLRRLIMIQAAIQLFLLVLLVFMAVNFQGGLQAEGRPQRFLHGVITTLLIQIALFYPINKLASRDAEREIACAATELGVDEMKAHRQKRLYSDYIKGAAFIFYVTFIYKVPKDLFILSIIFFSFILTFLTYFQCYNFAARRLMQEKS